MTSSVTQILSLHRSLNSPTGTLDKRPIPPLWAKRTATVVLACAAVGAVTAIAYAFDLNEAVAAFLHLIVIVLVARSDGFRSASVVSILAFSCQMYFLVPPALSWTVADPKNWITLGAFEYCALVVSSLAGSAAAQALLAERNRLEIEALFETSRRLLVPDGNREPADRLAEAIRCQFGFDAVLIYIPSAPHFASAGTIDGEVESVAREAYIQAHDGPAENAGTWFRVLRNGSRPVGAIAVRGGKIGEPAARALTSLVEIALDRARSLQNEARAEAGRRNERLRTAVLDALAHEVKTPLTVIRAASSGMIEAGGLAGIHEELAALIESESARIAEITDRLLRIARLDARDIRVSRGPVRLDETAARIVQAARERVPGRVLSLKCRDNCTIQGDGPLVSMALLQLVDNALKYSTPDSEISICIQRVGNEAVVSVHNSGPVIAPHELERIFERFYRSAEVTPTVSGTGLGLSIARKIAGAHGGRVWAVSDESSGTKFSLALPCQVDSGSS